MRIERDGRQRGLGGIGRRKTMNAWERDFPLHYTLVIDCDLTVLVVPHHLALASMYVSVLLVDTSGRLPDLESGDELSRSVEDGEPDAGRMGLGLCPVHSLILIVMRDWFKY